MRLVPLGASSFANSQRSSDAMSSSRLFLGRLLSSRACLRFADWERFSQTTTSPYNHFSSDGDCPLNSLSQPKGAVQNAIPFPHTPIPAQPGVQ